MNRCKKYLAIFIAVMMFATTFTMVQPVTVSAETTESTETTVVEAEVTGGILTFDTSTGTVTGVVSLDDTGTLIIPETIEGVTVKTIGQQAFMGETSLISVEIPDNVELIDQNAFSGCSALGTVKLPANLKTIGDYAFSSCVALNGIELPEGMSHMFGGAFMDCTSLESINIPASVTGVSSFLGCTALTEITVSEGNSIYHSIEGVLFDTNSLICYPAGKSDAAYSVPEDAAISSIAVSAFSTAKNLTSVHIPGNITEIGATAFNGCTSLETVTFDEGLVRLGGVAFADCAIKEISFPDSLQKLSQNSIFGCTDLTTVNLGKEFCEFSYGGEIFAACSALSDINVDKENTVFSSVDGVLYNKEQTTLIRYPEAHEGTHYDIPETVTEIAESAFQSANNLETVQIPDSVTTIGSNVLKDTRNKISIICNKGSAAEAYATENGFTIKGNIYEVAVTGGTIKFDISTGTVTQCVSLDGTGTLEIPEIIENVTVKAIADVVFSRKQALTKVILPDTIESIGESAFLGCYHLEEINMPASLKTIGDRAFYDNEVLTTVTLPEKLETIGEEAFSYSAITGTIVIPASVTSIYESAFDSCTKLTAINVADGNTVYRSEDGVLFDTNKLVNYPAGKTDTEYVMPVLNGIEYIGERAFAGNDSLTKVTIAEGVDSILPKAFYDCTSLADVEFPSTLTTIRDFAFKATALKIADLPDSVTKIWSCAFDNCKQLTQLNLSANTIIYWYGNVFLDGCESLTAINVDESNSTYISDNGVLFSKDGTILWRFPQNHATTVYEIPDTVTEIKPNAFSGCVNLQQINLPEGLKKIGDQAFSNCDSLQSITIPEGVTEIEGYAFSSCDSLKVVTIPSSVTTIGSQLLYNTSQEIVIVCESGSAAAQYAVNNSIPYSYDGKTIVGTGEEFENPDSVEPTQSEQEIICDDTFSKVYGCEDFSLGATAQTALTYVSNNTSVADVSADGTVTIKKAGTATVTIIAAETDAYMAAEKTVTITVDKVDQEISGATEFAKTYGCDTFNLDATAKTALAYKSNNIAVADVDEEGNVTVNGAGTAIITITAADGDNYNTAEKTVSIKVAKADQEISGASEFAKVYGDKAFNLDATAKTALTYKSNNTTVVDVDTEGTVTVKGAGEATITITAADGDNYNTAEKTVSIKVAKADQEISGVSEFAKVYGCEAFNLDAVAKTALTYKSNNTAVADVSEDGTVTVKGAGEATITITAATGDNYNTAEKTVSIKVAKADQEISGVSEFSKVYGDAAFKLDAGAQTDLTYKSNNITVADVSEYGTVTVKGAGTATITITAATGDNYNTAEKTVTIKVAKADQEISGATEFAKVYGCDAFNLDATAKTALTYKSNNTAVADVSEDGNVTVNGAGEATITITAADGVNYNSVEKTVTITVVKADQEISGATEFAKIYGDATFNLDAVAKTALAYKSNNTTVVDVDTEGNVTVKGAGTATITITAATGDNYNTAEKIVTIKVAKSDQTISGASEFTKVYGDAAFNLDAVAQTALTYKSNNTTVTDVDTEGNVTVKGAGTATITITAETGDNYNTAEKTVTITVNKADQEISGAIEFAKIYGCDAFDLDAVAKTALTYKSNNTAVADVNTEGTVTVKGAGEAIITITAATGDNHNTAEKAVTIKAAKADQEISGATEFAKIYGDKAFNLDATAETALIYKSSNTSVADVNSEGQITIKSAGTAKITITAIEGTNYKAAEKTVTVTVSKADQTISGTEEFIKTYGCATFNLGATAKTDLTYKSNNTAIVDVDAAGNITVKSSGTATITVTATEGANYKTTQKNVTIIVSKANQAISSNDTFVKTYGCEDFSLGASATTKLSYTSSDPAIATVSETGIVTVKKAGTVNIIIKAEGTDKYNTATRIVTLIVNKDGQTVTGTDRYTKTYKNGGYFYLDTAATTGIVYTSSNASVVTVAADGKVSIKGAGTATITATAAATDNYNSATKAISVTVNKASQTITCNKTFTKTFKPSGYFFLKAKSKTTKTYKSSNKKIATVSSTGKVTMKNPGKVTITITAKAGKNYKATTKKVTVTSKLKKPTLTVKAKSGKKNKLTWTKVPGASGYKVYIYDSSKGKYVCRLTKKASVKSVTHQGLKAGKKYKYKVRAYRVVNGKMVYSPYSAVKSVKAKK